MIPDVASIRALSGLISEVAGSSAGQPSINMVGGAQWFRGCVFGSRDLSAQTAAAGPALSLPSAGSRPKCAQRDARVISAVSIRARLKTALTQPLNHCETGRNRLSETGRYILS